MGRLGDGKHGVREVCTVEERGWGRVVGDVQVVCVVVHGVVDDDDGGGLGRRQMSLVGEHSVEK